MKKLSLVIIATLFAGFLEAQQDPQYTLYQYNQMIINPAYAGARDVFTAVALNRQQWVGFDGAPKTTNLSIHGPILNKNLGLGLTVISDRMGPRNTIGAYGNIAYILKISNAWKLSFGLNAGYQRYQFDYSKIEMKQDEIAPELFQNLSKGALDINGGLYLRNKAFFLGISATHLNSPDIYTYEATSSGKYVYKVNMHTFVTAGYSFIISDNFIFAPTVMVKQVQNELGMDFNANVFLYKKLWLGAFYRNGYGPGALIQFYFTKNVRAGLSYDTGLQDARKLGPSFEAMLGVDFNSTKSKVMNPRFL